jgi:hypothetical protein
METLSNCLQAVGRDIQETTVKVMGKYFGMMIFKNKKVV